jgi:2-keto-4-pentenoate hydratase/2-oxohepta-3-ene-1,7-dioic acid hydratase in catechol pathway
VRYVSFFDEDGNARPGVLEEGAIRIVDAPTLRDFIALPVRERGAKVTRRTVPATAKLDAPVRPARNVFCVGRNYLEHAREGARALGRELKLPDVPTFFTKATNAIAAPDSVVHLQARISSEYDFEAELAVVIGARCKDVEEANWRDVVFGYTCANDVTARDVQRAHGQWFKGKSFDETCPLGPWIVSADSLAEPQHLEIRFLLNGAEKQRDNTAHMIFPISRLIAELSRGMTLEPGDVIATGTPAGVGFARAPAEFLADRDTMTVEIEGIGALRNQVRIA